MAKATYVSERIKPSSVAKKKKCKGCLEHAPTLLDDDPVKTNYLYMHSDALILLARCKMLEEFDGCFTVYSL